MTLKPPFPYFGGKSRVAARIWKRLGVPHVYAEPFAGSLAVLLYRDDPADREIVTDLDGHICNFWRAMQATPDEVAKHADYPTIHQDLTARHRWLIAWSRENAERLSEEADYFDAKAAGWWAWGKSNWIGHGWCADRSSTYDRVPADCARGVQVEDKRPMVSGARPAGAAGTQRHRVHDKVPRISFPQPGGSGVQAQRNQIPSITGSATGGQGVQAERHQLPGPVADGQRLKPWFRLIQKRLQRVVVLNRTWQSAVTKSMMCDSDSATPSLIRAVFLDPPYLPEGRKQKLYAKDDDGSCAIESYEWAVEHGDRYRIAYCCNPEAHEVPDGWDTLEAVRMGSKGSDQIMFSPACIGQRKELF